MGLVRSVALVVLLAACTSPPGAPDDAAPGDGDATIDLDGSLAVDAPAIEAQGCDGTTLLENPRDPAARGPWAVGARTVTIGRLKVEVWYPAAPGSAAGEAPIRYDLREALPASQRAIIPDEDNPWQACDCYRDLPLDAAHGPYPVVVFVHGTAAFRHQSATQVTHWASRGFVVVAADHPGLMLGDLLAALCPDDPSGDQDLVGDVTAELAALASPAGDLGFLAGHVDTGRVAVTGHSAGGAAAAMSSGLPGVQVVIALAGAQATAASPSLKSTLYLAGMSDNIARFSNVKAAYDGSPSPRRLIGIAGAVHLSFSDLCETRNGSDEDLVAIANRYQICGAFAAGLLFDCGTAHLPGRDGWDIIDHASSTVLESVLQCAQGLPDLSEIAATFDDVAEYHQDL